MLSARQCMKICDSHTVQLAYIDIAGTTNICWYKWDVDTSDQLINNREKKGRTSPVQGANTMSICGSILALKRAMCRVWEASAGLCAASLVEEVLMNFCLLWLAISSLILSWACAILSSNRASPLFYSCWAKYFRMSIADYASLYDTSSVVVPSSSSESGKGLLEMI